MSFPDSPSPLLQLPNTYRAFYGAFPHLHSVQRQAIEPLLQGRDLILQSATGSGKTEAVLAPCIERVIRSGQAETVLYVVPTRALAIDLERRLDPRLTERLGLRLAVRTGDIKRAGGERPDLLLTTPESLDVTLGSPNPDLRGFIQRVRMVIIDEVHPLVSSYRGQQLAYLLQRLERRTTGPVQKVALSATIADVETIIRLFHFRPDTVRLIEPVQREIVPHLVHLKDEEREFVALLDDLYDTWGYRKVLVFANSRGRCDRLFALLSGHGRFQGVSELHYSNLKPKERRGVENRFRRRSHALCVATSTLELGIDIGDVDGVLLYEPPDSVSAFLQRIGRSNRRQPCTYFWGICRGERAGSQLLRFLGLLRLARQGVVESPPPRGLPSVLVQQILSCLYEKRQLSLPALYDLFPDHRAAIQPLVTSLVQQAWLREGRISGLFRGGRRYRDCLLARRIWSNFPETEEDYLLDFSGEAIADLPQSVVRQLEPGDRVQLAGKRLQVLQIDTGAEKRVVACPATQLDEKDLFWLGAGFRVSYEVAQSIREVLKTPAETADGAALGLFARTRRLLRMELERNARTVTLANGIDVGRGPGGLYRYRTFLGSLGNLILQWTIQHDLGPRLQDLTVTADEVGIDCSHLIDFQTLHLPVNRDAFRRWVERHIEALRPLFPLNAFCAVLPSALQTEELTEFLFDSRVAGTFSHYLTQPSEIVSGDPAVLDAQSPEPERRAAILLDTARPAESLLAWEKHRWRIGTEQGAHALPAEARHEPRALTGTMVGEYLRHQQCERWLSFSFVPAGLRPRMRTRVDTDAGELRTERGRLHETRVLAHLRAHSGATITVEEADAEGKRRSLRARFEESLERLIDLVRMAEAVPDESLYLYQAVLILPSVLGRQEEWMRRVDGVGIPDLIRVSMGHRGPIFEVGDIKDSWFPHDSQKWQVAFYALLLRELFRLRMLPVQAEVSTTGFLITRPLRSATEPEPYHFDLQPYFAAFPALLRNVSRILQSAPSEATYRLQEHCTTCPYFEHCYREGLQEEDVLFLPHLTAGTLQKLRQLRLKTAEAAGKWLERTEQAVIGADPFSRDSGFGVRGTGKEQAAIGADPFSPQQRERLAGRVSALRMNQISLRERKTRLFPVNLSIAIFVHLIEDRASGLPRGLGWRALDSAGTVIEAGTWIVPGEEDMAAVWQAFSDRFLKVWRERIGGGRGPHIFHFGERSWRLLQVWGEGGPLAFLWAPGRVHRTDLRRVLAEHFDLPIPGTLTLFAVGRLLSLQPELDAPESLFHTDVGPTLSPEEWVYNEERRQEVTEHLDDALVLQTEVWQWLSLHLESEWTQQDWATSSEGVHTLETPFLNFLEEERRLREEDILSLQTYTLPERVDRFRAIGPLTLAETTLDDEGRFLYGFQTDPELGLSKFREGDFLKLAPVGTLHLQDGFPVVLVEYDRTAGRLRVRSRGGRLTLNTRIRYSLEEDLTDWNGPKLVHAVRTVFSADRPHSLSKLLSGELALERDPEELRWVEGWLRAFGPAAGLNPAQQQALELPFQRRLSLIEGPPGTGKTHLLGWTLIALVQRARELGIPLRIVISALTHQAIDQVLSKVVELVTRHRLTNFPGRCLKWGRWMADEPEAEGPVRVEPLTGVEDLAQCPYPILGATGFGLYQLFEGQKGTFPRVFDWVVFDEASQVLIPQALLSLIYGKGQFLFCGDIKQLPPVVLGHYEGEAALSGVHHPILFHLLDCYGPAHRVRLDQTYRMNEELCAFPSQTWYDGVLRAAPGNAHSRIALSGPRKGDLLDRVLDPERPVVLLLVDHRGCHQQSDREVEVAAELAYRLMAEHGLSADRLALISPHRAQNNATADRLGTLLGSNAALPLIDTVERVQGAEREVILFALTTSDLDHIESEFLNNPNRFNVAITRARQKLIVVGSQVFFSTIPQTEDGLKANRCFKAFFEFCQARGSVFWMEEKEE